MARNLYRSYLYIVFLAMLILAAVGLGWLLQPLLALTALRGSYSQPPANMALVQGIVFFGISWIVAGLLGGFHYWLIRRDMQGDPDAGNQGVRSFFLNIAELIVAPLGIGLFATAFIGQLGQPFSGDLSYVTAASLAILALFVILELERRRRPAGRGVALFFQRLHLYGVQFILLNILGFTWIYAFSLLVNLVAFAGQASGSVPCAGFVTCSNGPNLISALASALWVALFWLGYGWLARNDPPSLFRQIVLAISFAYGIGVLLYGIYLVLALLFRNLFGVAPSVSDTLSGYNFVAYITLGLLLSAAYFFWLSMPAIRQARPAAPVVPAAPIAPIPLICQAIIAALMAVVFFVGVAYLLLDLLESPASPVDWAQALALVITGVSYVFFDLLLRRGRRANAPGAMDARRGFVFAMLGASILAVAIGGAVALYSWITALIGSPLNNWPHVAHIGLSAFIVGALVLLLFLWQARSEQLIGILSRRGIQGAPAGAPVTPAVPSEKATSVPGTQPRNIEEILDELLAGKLTRDQAAARIRSLSQQ